MRSRVLLGVCAWLLGAASATAGSLYAVGQLGNSLLEVPTKSMSVNLVNKELRQEASQRAKPQPSTRRAHHQRPSPPGSTHHKRHVSPSPTGTPTPSSSSPVGVLLTSADGSANAVCEAGGAYLQYSIPQPGFEVDDVNRGPASVASVSFQGDSGGILMRVSCQGGVPVKQLTNLGPDDSHGGGH